MGMRQDNLKRLLSRSADLAPAGYLSYPTPGDLAGSLYMEEIHSIYRSLGGVLDSVPLNLRSWDTSAGGVAIELDEQLHFSRYRALTLRSPLYARLPYFPLQAYSDYCDRFEGACLKAGSYGGKWTNPSCEKQFGKAAPAGSLEGGGAPRWKQRAFYDFVKDLSPLIVGVAVVRISVWDEVTASGRKVMVGSILDGKAPHAVDALETFVMHRIQQVRQWLTDTKENAAITSHSE